MGLGMSFHEDSVRGILRVVHAHAYAKTKESRVTYNVVVEEVRESFLVGCALKYAKSNNTLARHRHKGSEPQPSDKYGLASRALTTPHPCPWSVQAPVILHHHAGEYASLFVWISKDAAV